MTVAEHIMDHLATACNISGDELRRSNMYKIGDPVPFGMIIGESDGGKWNVPTMWDRLFKELDIPSRRAQIDEYNSKNKWTKRGLSLIPTKFGIAFTAKYMVRLCWRLFICRVFWSLTSVASNVLHTEPRWSAGSRVHGWYCSLLSRWYGNGSRATHQSVPSCCSSFRHSP